jgi:hypothetical protein
VHLPAMVNLVCIDVIPLPIIVRVVTRCSYVPEPGIIALPQKRQGLCADASELLEIVVVGN